MEKVVKDAGAGKKKVSTRQLVSMAMLGAISIVLVSVVHFPLIPAAAFLEYDPADIPILIGTFAYGPLRRAFDDHCGFHHTRRNGQRAERPYRCRDAYFRYRLLRIGCRRHL